MINTENKKGWAIAATIVGVVLIGLWMIRPLGIIHGILLWFYQYPLLWMLPLLTIILIIAVAAFFSHKNKKADPENGSQPRSMFGRSGYYNSYRKTTWEKAGITGLFLVPTAFFLAMVIAPFLTGQAIYNHYGPFEKTGLPESAETRIMPKSVAETLARNGFASPTETLENGHLIQTSDGLRWTFGQSPDGTFRRITKKTAGSASLDANSTTRNLKFYKGQFEVGPGQVWADGVTWKAYKKNYWTNVAESIYLPGPGGGKILVPYIAYEGFFVKVPVLGGAYLISPDGSIEDLSPEEAAQNPLVQSAGRLFPSELARRVQDSFAYTNGIWNRVFTHKDVLVVEDRVEDSNPQPHYISVEGRGEWVSIGEPWGRADAVGGVFLTDAITGDTRLWRTNPSSGLTSSRRAQDATEALAIPGVSFRAGDFRAIEPRPVFRDGKLLFLVSIVPKSGATVSKSVVIEPKTNKAVAVFSHDDPGADADLLAYLQGEEVGGIASDNKTGETDSKASLSDSEKEVIEDLLRQNEEQKQALEELLRRAEKG